MTNPIDRAPDELMEAAAAANVQQVNLMLTAWAKGIRDGMESAAQLCEAVAKGTRELPIIADVECAQIAIAEFMRDQIRLAALQIPAPEVAT